MSKSCVPTHIPLLDDAFNGGIKCGTGLGVYGALGVGKTILSMQIAYNNIKEGVTCCFHTHDQSEDMLIEKMKAFGWNPEPYMDCFHIVDWYTILGPSEDELDDAPALSVEESLQRKMDFTLLLKRANKEMRGFFDGHLPDLLIADSLTPMFMQMGGRKLYIFLRMARQLFLRKTVSVVTIHSDIVDEREMNALSSLSDYFVKMEKLRNGVYNFVVEKSMDAISNPSLLYQITKEGIKPLEKRIVKMRMLARERFEYADIHANLIIRDREVKVGEDIDLEIVLVNEGKAPVQLIKVEYIIPEGFELKSFPEICRVEGSHLDMKGRTLSPLKTEELRLILRPLNMGTFHLRPRVLYLDESGMYKFHEPEPATVKVRLRRLKGPPI